MGHDREGEKEEEVKRDQKETKKRPKREGILVKRRKGGEGGIELNITIHTFSRVERCAGLAKAAFSRATQLSRSEMVSGRIKGEKGKGNRSWMPCVCLLCRRRRSQLSVFRTLATSSAKSSVSSMASSVIAGGVLSLLSLLSSTSTSSPFSLCLDGGVDMVCAV